MNSTASDDLSPVAERSYAAIRPSDLLRLADLGRVDREDRFARRPRWADYADRVICTALCQGGAQHFIDGATRVKDFDVWTFYAEIPGEPYPPRWHTTADFGSSRFGRRESEPHGTFLGR